MKNHRLILPAILLAMISTSCKEPDERLQVVTGQQGQTEVQRVPYTPEEEAHRERVRKAYETADAPTAPPVAPAPQDPDLATLESNWQKLNPADRATILDLSKRLAAGQK